MYGSLYFCIRRYIVVDEQKKLEKILNDIQEQLTYYPSIVDDDPKQDAYYLVSLYLTKSEMQLLEKLISSHI